MKTLKSEIFEHVDALQNQTIKAQTGDFKGTMWMMACLMIMRKYGIHDDSIPKQIEEVMGSQMESNSNATDAVKGLVQDAWMDFQNEYNRALKS